MTDLQVAPSVTDTDNDEGPIHIACCVANISLCGYELNGAPAIEGAARDELCIVCDDLESTAYQFCPVLPVCVRWAKGQRP